MKFLFSLLFLFSSLTSFAGFEGLNDDVSLKIFNRINCGDGLTCSRAAKGVFNVVASGVFTGALLGDGGDSLSGFLQEQVVATATTITAAQCGSSFINSGAIQMELPEASAVLGCRLTFITGNASNFDVNPDDADIILIATNAAGDAMRNATLGNSITIEAISATQWVEVSIIGTWTDID